MLVNKNDEKIGWIGEAVMDIRQAMQRVKVLANVQKSMELVLRSNLQLHTYKKNASIFQEQSPISYFYFVVTGVVYLCKLNHHNENRVIFLCTDGEMLNETIVDGQPSSISAIALTQTQMLRISVKTMKYLMGQDAVLAQAVMESMASKIRRLYQQMKNTSSSVPLEQQIAAKLRKLGRDYGIPTKEGIKIPFDLSITFFADMVGSKRETVSRNMKRLVDQGLIRIEGKTFYIMDQQELLKFFHKK